MEPNIAPAPESQDDEQPVAYDVDGRPLYAHPAAQPVVVPATSPAPAPSRPEAMVATQAVHMTQPDGEDGPFVSDSTRIKHEHSKQEYPDLNLEEDEYVIAAIRKHPIGLVPVFGFAILLIAIAFSLLFNFNFFIKELHLSGAAANPYTMFLVVILFTVLVILGAYIAYYVYINDVLYLTNCNLIDVEQMGVFSRHQQSISLGSIEDASYTQEGFLQDTVGYGSIRLGTMGDVTGYTFNYVFEPQQYIETVNTALDHFKGHKSPMNED